MVNCTGPAIEYANGTKHWYLNDKLHREDGPAVELEMKKIKNKRPAEGQTGFIISGLNKKYFRVYKRDENGKVIDFTDYDICHHDLKITIVDSSAELQELEDGKTVLDYSEKAVKPVSKEKIRRNQLK